MTTPSPTSPFAASSAPLNKPAVWRTGAAAALPAAAPAAVALEEVAPVEPDDDAATATPAAYVDLVERVMPAARAMPAAPAGQPAGPDFAALERALSERIVQQLMPRVEALVAERLEGVLQELAYGLRAGLGESIAQAVAASVQQELASLRSPKK